MFRINNSFVILILIATILISCENDDDNNLSEYSIDVLAGIHETNGYHKNFIPSIKLEEREYGCLLYRGADSVDVDNDNDFDIRFISCTQTPDISGSCCDCPDDPDIICDCWPTGRIYKHISVIDTTFQIASNELYPICFSYGDTIDILRDWNNGQFLTLIDINNFPPPESSYGNWTSKEDYFIGIRKVSIDTLYGWIKLNLNETIEIKELYIE